MPFLCRRFYCTGYNEGNQRKWNSYPEGFGVMGFDNEAFDEHITPSLSSIDQQTVLMGKEDFALLLIIIDDKSSRN